MSFEVTQPPSTLAEDTTQTGPSPSITLVDNTASEDDFIIKLDADKVNMRDVADSDGDLVVLDLDTNRVGIGRVTPGATLDVNGATLLDGAVTINDAGADVDFRVESDTDANALFVDGTNGKVGIGKGVPASPLHINFASIGTEPTYGTDEGLIVAGGTSGVGVRIITTQANNVGFLAFGDTALKDSGNIIYDHNSDSLRFHTSAIERFRMSSTEIVANDIGADVDFRIESDTDVNAFFLQGSDGNIGVGTASPGAKLEVNADAKTATNAVSISADALTTGEGIDLSSSSVALTGGELSRFIYAASGDSLAAKTGSLYSFSASQTDTRTSGTSTENYDTVSIDRSNIMNGAGGTMDADGAVLRLANIATETAGTLTSDVVGLEMNINNSSSSDTFAISVISNNAGSGVPGGIDMSTFSVDEPVVKAVADAVSSAGTLTHQIAIDIGGTIFYLNAFTHGS